MNIVRKLFKFLCWSVLTLFLIAFALLLLIEVLFHKIPKPPIVEQPCSQEWFAYLDKNYFDVRQTDGKRKWGPAVGSKVWLQRMARAAGLPDEQIVDDQQTLCANIQKQIDTHVYVVETTFLSPVRTRSIMYFKKPFWWM